MAGEGEGGPAAARRVPEPPTWRAVARRAMRGVLPRRLADRRPGWSLGVPVIALAAGLLFTTSATTADGTVLREDRRPQLTELIGDRQERIAQVETRAADLEREVERLTAALGGSEAPVQEHRDRADAYRGHAGFTALTGPGLTVTLDDAQRRADGGRPAGATNDDLIVHQADVQAVVNALWAGGAEAMTIMGVRVISTSAVICVGNVLLLHGRTYSPPFHVSAIGDPEALRTALAGAPGVQLFRDAVAAYGLGYRETVEDEIAAPAYDGLSTLQHARVPESR